MVVGDEKEGRLQAHVASYRDNQPVPKKLVAKMKRTGNRRRSSELAVKAGVS